MGSEQEHQARQLFEIRSGRIGVQKLAIWTDSTKRGKGVVEIELSQVDLVAISTESFCKFARNGAPMELKL